jgi:hypothetical protein
LNEHFGKKISWRYRKSGVDVRITIFCDFCQFSLKKLTFFSKTNVMTIFCKNLQQSKHFFKIITSIPVSQIPNFYADAFTYFSQYACTYVSQTKKWNYMYNANLHTSIPNFPLPWRESNPDLLLLRRLWWPLRQAFCSRPVADGSIDQHRDQDTAIWGYYQNVKLNPYFAVVN